MVTVALTLMTWSQTIPVHPAVDGLFILAVDHVQPPLPPALQASWLGLASSWKRQQAMRLETPATPGQGHRGQGHLRTGEAQVVVGLVLLYVVTWWNATLTTLAQMTPTKTLCGSFAC